MASGIRVTRLYVSSPPNGVQDDTPNEVGGNRRPTFSLMLEAGASDQAGDENHRYTLIISVNPRSGAPAAFAPMTLVEHAGDTANDWKKVTPNQNDGYIKQSTYTINAADFQPNGLYEFLAVLRQGDGSVSIVRSNEFFIS